jgi:phage baseplate assembly protein V
MTLGNRDRRDTDSLVKNMTRVGRVTDRKVDATGVFVRCAIPDRVDPKGDPLQTGWLSVPQVGAGGLRGFSLPRIGTLVPVHHYGNSIENGYIGGVLFSPTNPPPPVTDQNQVVLQGDDGGFIAIDPNSGDMLVDFKGPIRITTEGTVTVNPQGAVTITSASNVDIQAPTITMTGDVIINGILTLDGIVINTHRHTGVVPGGGFTGEPIN